MVKGKDRSNFLHRKIKKLALLIVECYFLLALN